MTQSSARIMDHALALMVHYDREDYWWGEKESYFFETEEVFEFIKKSSFLRLYQQCRSWTTKEVKRELVRKGPNVRRSKGRRRSSGYMVAPANIEYRVKPGGVRVDED